MKDLLEIRKILINSLLVLGFFCAILITIFFYFFYQSSSNDVKEANNSYKEGESSTTVSIRKAAFNHALELYLELENHFQPEFGNGKLYFNIANTYFQLEEYPLAILYYYRASALSPYDKTIQDNLSIALSKVHVQNKAEKTPFKTIFFFHNLLPLPIRFQIFFIFSLVALIMFSMWFWGFNKKLKLGALFFLSISIIMFFSLLYSYFLENPSAIIIKPTSLYRGAGTQFAKVSDIPVEAGSKVTVLQVDEDGEWLKIEENNTIGFVQSNSIKII